MGFLGGSDGKESIYREGYPGWKDPLEEGMATHSSFLGWRILWTEKPSGLQSMGSQRVCVTEWLNTTQIQPPEVVIWLGVQWGPVMCLKKALHRISAVISLFRSSLTCQRLMSTGVFCHPPRHSVVLWHPPAVGVLVPGLRFAQWAFSSFLSNNLQCYTVRCSAAVAREENPYVDTTLKVRAG